MICLFLLSIWSIWSGGLFSLPAPVRLALSPSAGLSSRVAFLCDNSRSIFEILKFGKHISRGKIKFELNMHIKAPDGWVMNTKFMWETMCHNKVQ